MAPQQTPPWVGADERRRDTGDQRSPSTWEGDAWHIDDAAGAAARPQAHRWYVAHLKPRAEVRVAAILSNRGIQTFLPLIRTRRGTAKLLTEPLFRGYAFVHLDLGSEEPLIARCSPGVQYLLGRSEPTPVPRSLVGAIRVRTEHENRERGEIGFRSGDRVRVMSKALRDVEAIFDRALSASGRTRVFIRLLGRLVPMDVNIELLAAG